MNDSNKSESEQGGRKIGNVEAGHPESMEALRENNAFLRNIIESSSSISIISTDLDSNIVYWNSGAENIFGYKAEEVVGKQKIDILYSDEDAQEAMADIRSTLLDDRRGASFEIREVSRDGRKLWINMTLTPRLDEQANLRKEKNFFETRVIEYQTGGALSWD